MDFTSALYLGLDHAGREASRAGPLSLGKPAALEDPPGAVRLAAELARLAGSQAGIVAPSALHLFWDLASMLASQGCEFAADEDCYPITRWALERAAWLGSRVRWFRHHDPDSLERALRTCRSRPVAVTDGFCPACGAAPPVREYLAAVRARSGWLLIDDTQPFGIFGSRPSDSPYGTGGGGSARFHGVNGPDLLVAASLGKAFGTPLAALLGPSDFVNQFESAAETRVHCSPPSIPVIDAGLGALRWNRIRGGATRASLLASVREIRTALFQSGWSPAGGIFPLQTLAHAEAAAIHRALLARGLRTFLRKPHAGVDPRIGIIITARHRPEHLTELASALDRIQPRRRFHGLRARF